MMFAGHSIVAGVLKALTASSGLGDATEVILFGDSAGGTGTWINVDFVADQLPHATVVAAPIAGFYSPAYPYQGPDAQVDALSNFTVGGLKILYSLWSSFAPVGCAAAFPNNPSACLMSNASMPYIKSRYFVTEALTDSVQLTEHDSISPAHVMDAPEQAYIAQWRANMTAGLSQPTGPLAAGADVGGFAAACFIHTSFSQQAPLIGGKSYIDALKAWYFARGVNPASYKLIDTCTGFKCGVCPAKVGGLRGGVAK